MVQFETIADPSDPRLADYIGLTDPQIRRRYEHERFFIAEGIEVVKRLIDSNVDCRSIVVASNRLEAMEDVLPRARCPVYVAERRVVSQVVGFDLHRGVIASGRRPDPVTLADVLKCPSRSDRRHRIAVLHGVSDHENLGAVIRSARAFHIDALVLDPTCADPYYRRTVRVSMGEIFFLPIVFRSVHDVIAEVRSHGGTTVAFTPRLEAIPVDDLQISDGPLAMIFGSEGFGLPDEVLRAAEVRARIPIAPEVDSLNVGHAAAVAFSATAAIRAADQPSSSSSSNSTASSMSSRSKDEPQAGHQ